jgi:hypothetical protein
MILFMPLFHIHREREEKSVKIFLFFCSRKKVFFTHTHTTEKEKSEFPKRHRTEILDSVTNRLDKIVLYPRTRIHALIRHPCTPCLVKNYFLWGFSHKNFSNKTERGRHFKIYVYVACSGVAESR